MGLHKLLEKQIIKYLDPGLLAQPGMQDFLQAVSSSYASFERDLELSAHAFAISENEYREVNETLSREAGLRRQSIQKLKQTLSELSEGTYSNLADDDLLSVIKYLNEQIVRRKQMENALRLSEDKYRSIIANMNLGLLEVDLEDRIIFANQSFLRMCGYEMDEIIGKQAARLFAGEKWANQILSKKPARLRGQNDVYEVPIKTRTGEERWWLISGAPKFNQSGEVEGSIGIHLDITEQKKQESDLKEARIQAEESSRLKAAFLANMSHEIRTPLNAITGMLRELLRTDIGNKQKDLIANADFSARHLLFIINNILDISKIEAGEFQMDEINFNLCEVVQDTAGIVRAQAEEKSLSLEVFTCPGLSPVFVGDPGRIRQILLNLLGNAIKFTEVGKVSITCQVIDDLPESQRIQIHIADTGIGMDKSYLKNLFNKFSQEDKSTARKYGGTGLGMAITYELVHLMGGEITVESEKHVGTTVRIVLELKKGLETAETREQEIEDLEILRHRKILLVEDNQWNRLVANHSLAQFEMDVTEAENGVQALKLLREHKYDLILMDVQMPIMDGFEATVIIRNEMKITTPIIALTANAFKKETDKCLEVGMNDFVIKPYNEKVLLSTLARHLHTSKMAKTKEEPLYDLSELRQISDGDPAFFQSIISVFLDQLPEVSQRLSNALLAADSEEIRKVMHFMKPSAGMLGIQKLFEEIRIVLMQQTGHDEIMARAKVSLGLLEELREALLSEINA